MRISPDAIARPRRHAAPTAWSTFTFAAWATLLLPAACYAPVEAAQSAATGQQRIVVRSEDELPRHEYHLPTATASALLDDDAAFGAFADAVERDIRQVLASYAIDDPATLRRLHVGLADIALFRGDAASLRQLAPKLRELSDKPSRKLMSGLDLEAHAAALDAPPAARATAYRTHFAAAIEALPWDVVQDDVRALKGAWEVTGENLIRGDVAGYLDPLLAKDASLDDEAAAVLLSSRAGLLDLAYRSENVSVLADYIARHHRDKPDIWQARNIALEPGAALTPVVIGIWDSGIDVSLFEGQLFRNPREEANGRDDDGNGFVDDLHGIAYGMYGGQPSASLLLPLDDVLRQRVADVEPLYKGRLDIIAGIDSAEATATKAHVLALAPEDVPALLEAGSLYSEYAHGTHVAGIAIEGNPAVRVLGIRQNFSWATQRAPITPDVARQWAERMRQTGRYLHEHGARAVTMSWTIGFREIEGTLVESGIGADAAERRTLAEESLRILTEGLVDAIRSAPDTLFIPAAGNANQDVGFHRDIPTALDLPNLLFVGAVDQSGEATGFTSTGERVRIFANGFQVDSLVPGGGRMRWSGTSMAAPQVANLAGKLWAIEPSLSVAQVVQLINDGADRSEDGRRYLVNPKRSIELLAQRRP